MPVASLSQLWQPKMSPGIAKLGALAPPGIGNLGAKSPPPGITALRDVGPHYASVLISSGSLDFNHSSLFHVPPTDQEPTWLRPFSALPVLCMECSLCSMSLLKCSLSFPKTAPPATLYPLAYFSAQHLSAP